MKLEKEDKQNFVVGIIACFLIAAIVTFSVWMWRSLNRPKITDSSKEEIQVVVKDSIETMKWKERAISAEKKLSKWQIMYDHLKLTITQKQINDEKTNKFIQAICNDSIILFRDSLRAEYRRKRWGLVDNLQLQ